MGMDLDNFRFLKLFQHRNQAPTFQHQKFFQKDILFLESYSSAQLSSVSQILLLLA